MSMDYMVKYKANGTIEHFKVKTGGERLSLNPCDQLQKDICTYNQNQHTSSLIIFNCELRLIIIIIHMNKDLLHGELSKKIHMNLPP
jgi:hypothetical protein